MVDLLCVKRCELPLSGLRLLKNLALGNDIQRLDHPANTSRGMYTKVKSGYTYLLYYIVLIFVCGSRPRGGIGNICICNNIGLVPHTNI